ncbi:DNA primase [Clostridium hydrogenum]|uniref:DNA primase n=1 Tax=Clostridium hydrogenum TaxID=2855764 RepID=UPI001F425BBD|nr:DNA primase [Clostridium hydrogenum]
MISEEVIQKIKDLNDIVDIVSEKVKLKKAGHNYIGLCPFHNEKTPSFSVSQDKQIYKCFGCGESGNVITFIMKTKNLPFVEAVNFLAEKVNISVELNQGNDKKNYEQNNKLYKINVEAARYFFNNLNQDRKAKQYFLSRKITEATMRSFGLGYAKDDWNNLLHYMKNKGYTELDLINAGLIIQKNNTFYDRFRNRVIFPVFDYRGRVIGFGGRVLDDSKPKYLNSPETAVFKKGINLYGLNFSLKNNIDRFFIIVEGYMDCITLHQYGIKNAVASLGTALTKNQAKLLKRYADKIIISYDADSAGQTATLRGLKILKEVGFEVSIIKIPDGKDPDEFVKKNGREAFIELIKNALPVVDYRLNKAFEEVNLKDNESIIRYIRNVSEIIEELDPVEKDVYIKRISEKTGTSEQAIYDLLSEKVQKSGNQIQTMNKMDGYGQNLYVESAYIKSERALLKIMAQNRNMCEYIMARLKCEDLIIDSHKKIYNNIISVIEDQVANSENILKKIEIMCNEKESYSEWIKVISEDIIFSDGNEKKLIDDFIFNIKKFNLEESKKEIMKKIKILGEKGLFEETLELIKQSEELQNKLNNL